MKKQLLLPALLLCAFLSFSFRPVSGHYTNTESGSMSTSKSGYLVKSYEENGKIKRVKEYYYIYVYVYAYMRDGNVINHNCNFNRNGALASGGDMVLIGCSEDMRFLYYDNSEFMLKIGLNSSDGVWYKPKMSSSIFIDMIDWQRIAN